VEDESEEEGEGREVVLVFSPIDRKKIQIFLSLSYYVDCQNAFVN
jgi:hypothetical protein